YIPAGANQNTWGFTTWHPILVYGKCPYREAGKGARADTIKHQETSEKNGHPCPKPITLWRKVLDRVSVKELKAKALRHKFEETFVYGDSAASARQFDGIRKLVDTATASDQVIAMGATGATLSLTKIDELIDAVKGGKPDLLLMSHRSRRKIKQLTRAAGFNLESDRNEFGMMLERYNGIPIGVSDWVLDTHAVASSLETGTTGGSCSTIYAFSLGEGALCGLTAPGHVTVEPVGALETKDASRTRIKWYCSLALFSQLKAAALIGIKD
ncbi:MAG: hypothetical protein R6T78_04595, partial [Dehalococcoidales bacterium]